MAVCKISSFISLTCPCLFAVWWRSSLSGMIVSSYFSSQSLAVSSSLVSWEVSENATNDRPTIVCPWFIRNLPKSLVKFSITTCSGYVIVAFAFRVKAVLSEQSVSYQRTKIFLLLYSHSILRSCLSIFVLATSRICKLFEWKWYEFGMHPDYPFCPRISDIPRVDSLKKRLCRSVTLIWYWTTPIALFMNIESFSCWENFPFAQINTCIMSEPDNRALPTNPWN